MKNKLPTIQILEIIDNPDGSASITFNVSDDFIALVREKTNVMRVTKNSNGSYTYDRLKSIRLHVFRPEMYLLPIPDAEVRKMPAMLQNPGW